MTKKKKRTVGKTTKRKPFKLTMKKRMVGGIPTYDVLNQYGRPATRPFLNKSAAERYIKYSYEDRGIKRR